MSQMLVWNPPRYLRRRTGGAAVVDAIGVFSETTTSAIANAMVDSFLLARGVRTGGCRLGDLAMREPLSVLALWFEICFAMRAHRSMPLKKNV